jgi:hypothetical protein
MKTTALLITLFLALLQASCGSRKTDVAEAEKKLEDLEKQVDQARKDLATAQSEAAAPVASKATPAEPPKPRQYVLSAGTAIPVRTTSSLSTKTTAAGSTFTATLREALKVDGVELAPAGANVTGVVVSSDSGGRVKGKASIAVALRSIETTQGPIAIQTNSRSAVAQSTVKRDVVRGGIMTGAGAAIGAIAGGGKGAAIGALAGGGAGAGTALATKGAPAEIPAESALNFTLKAPVTVTVQP